MRIQNLCPTTCLLVITVIISFALLGPATDLEDFQSFPNLMSGVFRHGDWGHLLFNCALLLIGGVTTETKIGALPTALVAGICALAGLMAELLFAGPGFVGASGIAYGLIAYGLIATSPPERLQLNALLVVLALSAEFALLREELAVYTHIAAALTGGGIAMLSSLFGSKGAQLKQMEWKHVSSVIAIINQTDEDDAAEAEQIFLNDGYDNMFVLVEKGTVLGVTGFGLDDLVHDVAWLSWTYLDEESLGQGYGSQMLNDLLGKLAKHGIRKIFIETSDYEEFGKKIYASAHKLYEEFGANIELTLPDYHAVGEAKIIYGIDNPEAEATEPLEEGGDTGLAVTGVEKAPETDDVAGFQWTEAPVGVAGLDYYISQFDTRKYRMGLLAIPGDLSAPNAEVIEKNGFTHLGQLKDYYGTGQSQDWWAYQVSS